MFCAPVVKKTLASQIAAQLENMIVSKELSPGSRLPGEIELAERFGTSRNILREAITMLKERGLVQVRNGSGAYIVQPDAHVLGNVVNRLVAVGTASKQEVYELRVAIEVQASGLAAVNATAAEQKILDDLILRMKESYRDDQCWSKLDYDFHKQIAKSTHNTLFPEFIKPLINIVYDWSDKKPRCISARVKGIEQHKRIAEAVKSHDRAAAERAMLEHLKRFLSDLEKDSKRASAEQAPDGERSCAFGKEPELFA